MKITHASTFSGIGAPEIAAEMLGWDNLFHCEINPFGRHVLDYHFPKAKSYGDITQTDFSEWRGKVTVLTGGFPCQPFSYAGKRRGSEDDRYLWPYMLKCIEQIRPSWFVGENVAGIGTMVFPGEDVKVGSQADLFGEGDDIYERREKYVLYEIIENLENIGYDVQTFVIPACSVGAPHRRDRIFIVAHLAEPFADTDSDTDVSGKSRVDAVENGEGRLSERHKVQRSIEPVGFRREMEKSFADTESEQSDGHQSEQSGCCGKKKVELGGGCGESCDESGIATDTDSIRQPASERQSGFFGPSLDTQCEWVALYGSCGFSCKQLFADGRAPEWFTDRWRDFPSIPAVHRGNDGIPFPLDGLTLSFAKWKRESLKAYGNAIVPQIMYEIFRAIDKVERCYDK